MIQSIDGKQLDLPLQSSPDVLLHIINVPGIPGTAMTVAAELEAVLSQRHPRFRGSSVKISDLIHLRAGLPSNIREELGEHKTVAERIRALEKTYRTRLRALVRKEFNLTLEVILHKGSVLTQSKAAKEQETIRSGTDIVVLPSGFSPHLRVEGCSRLYYKIPNGYTRNTDLSSIRYDPDATRRFLIAALRASQEEPEVLEERPPVPTYAHQMGFDFTRGAA